MTRPLRIEYPGAIYHIFSRGNERKDIFRLESDYELFLEILDDTSQRYNFLIHAYCLMPNHFHMLIETPDANLCDAMKRLLGLYTVRFNRRHKRVGHLFQGRYKSLLVDKDNYFLQLSRYVHLNPVKAKLAKIPENYRWSSMRYYLKDKAPDFLFRKMTLESFPSVKEYKAFVLEGLDKPMDPFKEAIGGIVVGAEDFLEKIKPRILGKANKDYTGKRKLTQTSTGHIIKHLKNKDRNFSIYALRRFTRATQSQIGERFSVSHSAISHAVKRFEAQLIEDKTLQRDVMLFQKTIQNSKTDTKTPKKHQKNQNTLMRLKPKEEIGLETHPDNDQFFRKEAEANEADFDGRTTE